jgi:hypothetical protein
MVQAGGRTRCGKTRETAAEAGHARRLDPPLPFSLKQVAHDCNLPKTDPTSSPAYLAPTLPALWLYPTAELCGTREPSHAHLTRSDSATKPCCRHTISESVIQCCYHLTSERHYGAAQAGISGSREIDGAAITRCGCKVFALYENYSQPPKPFKAQSATLGSISILP